MTKYNKSEIMKNAWKMVKEVSLTISEALKKAWSIAKGTVKTLKDEMVEKMENLVSLASPVMNYRMSVKDWSNYGKNRTYLKVIETRDNSKHYIEYDFGYIDNNKNEYVAGKKDLNERYTLSGARF